MNTRWKNLNLRRKRKIFTVTEEHVKPNGFKTPIFDYTSYRPYNKFLHTLMDVAQEKGISQKNFIHHWNQTTETTKIDIQKILQGEKTFEVWELIMLLNSLNLTFDIKHNTPDGEPQQFYSSEIQTSSQGTKLLLKSNGLIPFILKFDTEDYSDWDIVFLKSTIKGGYKIYLDQALQCIKWYFQNTKIPFSIKLFKIEFALKYNKNEIKTESKQLANF